MKKFFLYNAIVAVVIYAITMIVSAKNPNVATSISGEYLGGSIGMWFLSLFDFFAAKKPTKREELQIIKIGLFVMDLLAMASVCMLIYEWLHVGWTVLFIILLVDGIALNFALRELNRELLKYPKEKKQ